MRGILEGFDVLFTEQYILPGGMILDFFLPTERVGIEVDGSIHNDPFVREKDRRKEEVCRKNSIHLVRIRNSDVFHHQDTVERRLRQIIEKKIRLGVASPEVPPSSQIQKLFCDYRQALIYCKQTRGTLKRFNDSQWIVY